MREKEKGEGWTEGDVEIAGGAVDDKHVDGELDVAEGGEEGAKVGNGVREGNVRARVEVGGAASGGKDAGPNHATNAKANEVAPSEGLTCVKVRASTNTYTMVR